MLEYFSESFCRKETAYFSSSRLAPVQCLDKIFCTLSFSSRKKMFKFSKPSAIANTEGKKFISPQILKTDKQEVQSTSRFINVVTQKSEIVNSHHFETFLKTKKGIYFYLECDPTWLLPKSDVSFSTVDA